jgi:hypothetical protein
MCLFLWKQSKKQYAMTTNNAPAATFFYAFDVNAVPGEGWQPIDLTRAAIRRITEQEADELEENYDMCDDEQTWVYATYEEALASWRYVARLRG